MASNLSRGFKFAIVALFIVPTFSFASFTAPAYPPPPASPDGNTREPINTGITAQVKDGGLVVGTSATEGQLSFGVFGGRVGIGTGLRLPATTLEVGTQGGGDGMITAKGFCFTGGNCTTSWSGGGGGGSGGVGGGGRGNYIAKWLNSSTLDNSLFFSGATGIGLGTETPTGLLHVNDISLTPAGRPLVNITRPVTQGGTSATDRKNAGLYILTKDYPLNVDVYNHDITNTVSPVIPAFTVDPTGKVGIKEANPVATLDVSGTIKANNAYLNGWSIYDGVDPLATPPVTFGQRLKIRSPQAGGIDVDKIYAAQANLGNTNITGQAVVSQDVTARKYCFPDGSCISAGGQGVTKVQSVNSYITVAPTTGTGDVSLSLGINPLVTYLRTIFQPHASIGATPVSPTPTDYSCPSGQALTRIY